jgi:hypothetical protein
MSAYRYFYAKRGQLTPKSGIYHRAPSSPRSKRSRSEFEDPTLIPADEPTPAQIEAEIYAYLLADKRASLYAKLMAQYTGSVEDVEALRAYLPDKYKSRAEDPALLEEQLLSESDFRLQVRIWDIATVNGCYGCLYDCLGQDDHMSCQGGCLHDPTICDHCSYGV